jgi:hypothetical protein
MKAIGTNPRGRSAKPHLEFKSHGSKKLSKIEITAFITSLQPNKPLMVAKMTSYRL